MANFYRITHSLDSGILGNLDQVVKAKYSCSIYDEHFIDQVFFEKAKFDPTTAKAILNNGAKLTDLIKTSIAGFGVKLLVSEKMKRIFQKNVNHGVEFFNSPLVKDETEYPDYFVLNAFEDRLDKVDFTNSEILLRRRKKGGGTETVVLEIKSDTNFLAAKDYYKNEGFLFINKLIVKMMAEDFLFIRYMQGGPGYFVSEHLKSIIEENGCTGIEFVPSELSLQEWSAPGGMREKKYGKVD
ncbi:MAG: hypothetical protein ABJ092_08010 [Gillisia sp.]